MKLHLPSLRITLLCLTVALITGCASIRTPQIAVMTYDIHHGLGGDAKVDLKRIADVIKRANPDLVALQEVDRKASRTGGIDEAAHLAELTGMHVEFGPTMLLDDGGEYGNAVLSKAEIKSRKIHTLPYRTGGRREPRGALEVRLEPNDQTGEIAFISTQLDQTDDDADRIAQAKALASLLAQEPDAADTPTILAGNFSCEPASEALAPLRRSGWVEATAKGEFLTSPAIVPNKKVDLVFVKPESRWKIRSAESTNEIMASDHRPVKVVLELQQKPKKKEPQMNTDERR